MKMEVMQYFEKPYHTQQLHTFTRCENSIWYKYQV